MKRSNIQFSEDAWEEYRYRTTRDRKTLKRIHELLKDTQHTPFEGLGKPEPLKSDLRGMQSRRINEKDRMVCRFEDDTVNVVQRKGHYDDDRCIIRGQISQCILMECRRQIKSAC